MRTSSASVVRTAFAVLALTGCIVVRTGKAPSTDSEPASSSSAEEQRIPPQSTDAPREPTVLITDLEARVAAARTKLADDPNGQVKELAAARAELLARWTKLESTLPQPSDGRHVRPVNPFFSDTLTKEAKDLLASTHTLRAAVWIDQRKVDDALRELVTTMGGASAVPCPTDDSGCKKAREAVSAKYKGFCWKFGSSNCAPTLGDDNFALSEKSKPLFFAHVFVKKVGVRGHSVDILTGDVPATDLKVCKGEFQTDKILDVNEKRILIERTTWCREMAQQRRVGWRVTHHLGTVPVAIQPGDHVLILAEAAKVRRSKVGEIIIAESDATLLAVERDRPIYRWNETMP
jgi:hypothetical protein